MYKFEIKKLLEKKMKQLNSNNISITLASTGEELDLKKERTIWKNILNSINQSIVFNFGHIDNMDSLVDSHLIQIKNGKIEPVSLPYQNCCFEYIVNKDQCSKLVVLITKDEIIPPSYMLDRIRANNERIMIKGEVLKIDLSNEAEFINELNDKKNITVISWICHMGVWKETPVTYMVDNRDMITTFNRYKLDTEYLSDLSYTLTIALTSAKLLTCKNIVEKEETVYKQKSIMKKGKLKQIEVPVEKYHILEIAIPKSKRNTNYEYESSEETTMPLHFCRGHFKTFTAEKPLLGRAVGTYWWQPSIRGSRENGVIEKDYNVNLKGE